MDAVGQDTMVTIAFQMTTETPEGEMEERPEEELTFLFGVERQVPSLEKALSGARVGQEKTVSIPAAELYGEHDPALIREIPRKGLIKQRIVQGSHYRQMKMGTLVSFKILEVMPNAVLADFNKPMAGVSARMKVKVRSIRPATREEIQEGLEKQARKEIGCG